ncbi:MAG: hypothetical protein AVDCRST_MAG58-803, partial [uncultured Rubrobacteraceae bacterium]
EARAAKGGPSGGPNRGALGAGPSQAGPQAGNPTGVGAGGKEAHRPLQEGLRVDLPLRLRPARERGGVLDDPAPGEHGDVLAGPRTVRRGGGSGRGQAHPFGGRQGGLAHGRRGRGAGRDTPGVLAAGLAGADAGREAVGADQRGFGQRALRGDRRGRRGADGTVRRVARSERDDQGADELPLVAPGGM